MRKGFTLLELLIAVSIIAALSALAVPLGGRMLAKTREATCLGNLRSMGFGLEAYLQDHQQTLPILAMGRRDRDEDIPVLETVLNAYLDNHEVFHCKADEGEFEKSGCSYHWNHLQNGLLISQVSFFGLKNRPEAVPLISDKESWHPGGTNFLYADYSTTKEFRFVTEADN